jgi:hypothetical protein
MITKNELKEIAHHEAAHAFAALHFGFGSGIVGILGDGTNTSGQTIISVPAQRWVFNDAVVDFAGNVTTEKYLNKPVEDFYETTDYRGACEKIMFYVAAKNDSIDPRDYICCDHNRFTRELFDELMLK